MFFCLSVGFSVSCSFAMAAELSVPVANFSKSLIPGKMLYLGINSVCKMAEDEVNQKFHLFGNQRGPPFEVGKVSVDPPKP